MRAFAIVLALLLVAGTTFAAPDPALQQEIDALKAQIQQLTERLQELEQRLQEQEKQPAPAVPATNLPQISVIANGGALFQDRKRNDSRNRFENDELEVAFQSWVYPSIRFDAILAFDKEEDFAGTVEEAYATVVQLGNTPFGAKLGRMRLPFGRVNPIHPHHLLHRDLPLPVLNLLGDHGAISNGAVLNYLLPAQRLYAQLQVGLFTLNDHAALGVPHNHANHHDEHENGEDDENGHDHNHNAETLGARGQLLRTARLAIAPVINRDNELEFGLSGLTTRAMNGDNLRLLGVDFQYRRFFGAAQRLLLSGEWFQHRRESGGNGVNRQGYYLLASYKPDRYWEYGVRYDWSQRAFLDAEHDVTGADRALSAILTYRMNEQSFIRLQWRNLKPADDSVRNELLFQLVFGFGPHSHPLESTQ
jgi:outer membrane murein-binding lipoprotein Lpp